jgi:3-isopropylmalate/(R)-2-methylmalate dehydratase small subunit
LADAGFRVVIAPGFADIFHGNCFKNGLLPITLDGGAAFAFPIDAEHRPRPLQGLDDIGLTLQHADRIRACKAKRQDLEPWLFG